MDVCPSSVISLTWDVHVGAVDVFARREIPSFLSIHTNRLLARPGLVPPWKEHQEELIDHVRVGYVEVRLEGPDAEETTDLNEAICEYVVHGAA